MSWRQGERVVGFPSGIWTPRRIANLEQWLDAGQGITLTSSKVSQWSDLSGNGKHATQTTAGERPTVVSAGLNGHDTISFTFAGQQNLVQALSMAPPCTVAFVAKTSVSANYACVGTWDHIYVYGANPFGTGWGVYAQGDVDAGAQISTFKRCIALVRNYNDVDLRTNGSSVTAATGVGGYGAFNIGGVTAQYLDGEIAEIVCFSRVLTVAESQKIEAYFAAKYGL